MTPGQLRSLVSRYIEDRLDEWEQSIAWSGLDEKVNGQCQACLAVFAQHAVNECTTALRSLRQGNERLAYEFMKRYELTMEPDSSAYRMLCRALVKAERIIQEKIREWAQNEVERNMVSR